MSLVWPGAPGIIGMPSTSRRAGNSIVYALGDSLTSQNIQTTHSYGMLGNGMSWARRLSMGRIILPIANINGGSGETAATIRSTRYPTAKASTAKTLVLHAGKNQGTSLTQDLDDITFMAQDFADSARDRIVFVFDEMPVDTAAGWDADKKARHVSLRDGIRALHRPSRGIYVVPSWKICTGGNDGNTPLAGFYDPADGIHPIIFGSFLLGQWLSQNLITARVPFFDPYSGATFAVGTALDGANFFGSDGAAISAASLAAANVVSSQMVVDGDTTWAELTINTTSGPSLNKSLGTLPSNVTPGVTSISSLLKVKLHAGTANVRALNLRQIKQSGGDVGTNNGQDMLHKGSSFEIGEIPNDEDVTMLLHTPPVTVAADATSVRWQLSVSPEIVGSVAQTMVGKISAAYGGMIIEP